jgi:nicotinamidase-related amidase
MRELEKVRSFVAAKEQAPLEMDPRRTALVVVDMQRYFAHAEYPFGQTLEKLVPGIGEGYFRRVREQVIPNVQKLLAAARAQGMKVVYTGFGCCTADGSDLVGWAREFNQAARAMGGPAMWPSVEDPAWQIEDAVAPQAGELVINKTTSGPLNSTDLERTLREMGVDTLVVCGLATDVCVTQTARETGDRSFRVIVAEDACTTLSEEQHRATLLAFNMVFGRVRKTADIVKRLSKAKAAGAR